MKKLYALSLPVLAITAFALVPASASALTTYGTCVVKAGEPVKAPCKVNEKFEPFTEERVSVFAKKISGTFVLENEAGTVGIECTRLAESGFFWNEAAVGHSFVGLAFEGCLGIKGLATTCGAGKLPNGKGIIEGDASDKVLTETTVEVKIEHDFNVECGTTKLGEVTGAVVGTQTASTSVLKFAKAKGLKFGGEPATITGELEAKQAETNRGIFI